MIDHKKVVNLIVNECMSQREVAKKLRVSQQAISKIWRAESKLRKGKRGGDRRSKRYKEKVSKRTNGSIPMSMPF